MKHLEWRDEILQKLDGAAENFMLPGQPNEGHAMADLRLTAFRADDEWLLVFEEFCAGDRDAACDNVVTSFGNRLEQLVYKSIEVVTGPGGASLWGEDGSFKPLDIHDFQVEIRGKLHRLTPSADDLRAAGVAEPAPRPEPKSELERQYRQSSVGADKPSMSLSARVIRLVAWKFPGEYFLSDAELLDAAGRSDAGLKRCLQIDDWQQPDVYESEKTSDIACFQSLASALAAGDPQLYHCPQEQWNTHWSNWVD